MNLLLLLLTLASATELPMDKLADKHWNTDIAVTAGGKRVAIAGGPVGEDHYFVLAPEGGEPQLHDVYDFLNWHKVTIEGAEFQLHGGLGMGMEVDMMGVAGEGANRVVFKPMALMEATYRAGADVTLGGRPGKFICGRRIAHDADGKLTFTNERFAALMMKRGERLLYKRIPLESLPAAVTIEDVTVNVRRQGETLIVE